ncbi:ARM repeat-containing protein [Paraphaeosphaeria sporulosa]|uniref:ARM repeat-containing protein n=1 Tax=Paraphaeosphaeria sporulosa TaxID=1460663 RepID=A0A177CVL6_9PLEO|nr:ARM repeat-containing protein [Paraphaeosphaeria sporulosa]OAG11068.1 ARM repeat-containing protein [Paraphaeosphaeria sporulosa]
MAFSTGIGERSGLRSPREESSFASLNLTSPLRAVGSQMGSSSASDARGQLHRRFTTNNIPTLSTPLSPIGQQRRQAAEPTDFTTTTATYHKLQVLEKKKLEYEYMKEQRRRIEAEMELIDMQSRQEEEEINRLSSDIRYGKHSTPSTPPEYANNTGFPSSFSRPNRFSMSAINPGLTTPRGSRAGSQITSPPSARSQQGNGFAAQSMPGSRRNSDEDGDDFNDQFTPESPVHIRNPNRFSMPPLGARNNEVNMPDMGSVLDFLKDEHEQSPSTAGAPYSLQMNTTKEGVPILVRQNGNGNGIKLSSSSAALDLALSQSPGPDGQSTGWGGHRHRHAQQSLPTNTLRKDSQAEEYDGQTNGDKTPKSTASNRRSIDLYALSSPQRAAYTNGMPKLQQSFSSNDVPTLKNGDGPVNGFGPKTHAEQHLRNHNANLGRVPANAMANRHSRELSASLNKEQDYRNGAPFGSALHASAAPFGPVLPSPAVTSAMTSPVPSMYSMYSNGGSPGPAYVGYGMSALNNAIGGMSLSQGPMYPPMYAGPPGPPGPQQFGSYNPYTTYGRDGQPQDSQARVIQSRRMQNDANRFLNYDLKTMARQDIYTLCKDQHGCRFLQKKLEEKDPENVQIIFEETAPHVVELMTDPFGNYLCQKLLEFSTDEQRNTLVRNAAPSLVSIALNQHGTRALQKMIEFISTPEQIQVIINALSGEVVALIQDLNGNHVIQKCLNHLKSEDAQFIFDAVGDNCVAVGTHRHGCCVLQRCIDHASGYQKVQLVRQITANSFNLVQDPFGNYVVQYILDLNEMSFTTPLCLNFQGHIAELSKQKFSSNVIEKCVRCADMDTKAVMIHEMMQEEELEKLMRDSYGNYVIQTALEFAPAELCIHLIEAMRPILPGIRQTPYGRRIQSKVQERESRLAAYAGGRASGHVSPHGTSAPGQNPAYAGAGPISSGYTTAPMYTAAASYGTNIASPQPHRMSNPPLPSQLQNTVQYPSYQFSNGMPNGNGHANGNFNGGSGNFF